MTVKLPLGPVMLDLKGLVLDAQEREMLCHPLTGGVILFARNYESNDQLRALTASIRAVRDPTLLIAVDHEGGRVQRFQKGFTRIPPMAELERLCANLQQAAESAKAIGTVIAHELLDCGIDFSFTPVLDVDFGRSGVIGNRAFSSDPEVITLLAGELIAGLHEEGMASVGKHFPGHGYVQADSHVALPVDDRSRLELEQCDLLPYRCLIPAGLKAIMPAHVIFPRVDRYPAGFSSVWLKDILRGELGFDGMIFSDDLSMESASVAGDVVDRASAAFEAGCDMVLVCNSPSDAQTLLCRLGYRDLDVRRGRSMAGAGFSAESASYWTALKRVTDSFV